ncbi:metallophosphatase superfamily protein [Aeromonas phage Atoyac13]|nr:metallophosphatase superfamily protein [Aeromonas phage Atoyac13]
MKTKLMSLFTKAVHVEILKAHPRDKVAAAEYTKRAGLTVSPQLVRYWRRIFLGDKATKAKVDRAIKSNITLLTPNPNDDIGHTEVPQMCHRIMVIGDLHEPYTHPDAYAFLRSVRDSYQPDMVVQMGDETDGHAISFHDSDPNLDSAGVELEKAKRGLERLHNLFPNLLLCDSNHGSLIYRRAKAHGLPVQMIKKYRDILFPEHGAPGWSWADAWELNTPLGKVRFQHQVASDIMLNAAHEGCSVVLGHEHGKFSVTWAASSDRLYFGAYAGCLIDRKSLAFAYGKLTRNKPILGCMVITDGAPQHIPMLMDSDGRWVGRHA